MTFRLPQRTNAYVVAADCHLADGGPCLGCQEFQEFERLLVPGTKVDSARRRKLLFKVNSHHDRIVGRLPIEISAKIFVLTLFDSGPNASENILLYSPIDDNVSFNGNKSWTPFVLGQVCGVWRDIAWSTPQLWSTVPIVVQFNHLKTHLEIWKGWLERSGDLPLSIGLYFSKKYPGDPLLVPRPLYRTFSPIFELINAYSHRWKVLEYRLQVQVIDYIVGNGKPTILDRINISPQLLPHNLRKMTGSGFTLKGVIPRPRKVTAEKISLSIDWEKVEDVHLKGFTLREWMTVLDTAKDLKSCVIVSFIDEPASLRRIVHTSLQRLIVRTYRYPRLLFACLVLPSLSELTCFIPNFDILDFRRFIARSGCSITKLTAAGPYQIKWPDVRLELIELIEVLPTVEELNLRLPLEDDFFKHLIMTDSAEESSVFRKKEIVLPKLFSLGIECDVVNFSWEVVRNLFFGTNRPLKSLEVKVKHFRLPQDVLAPATAAQLDELVQRGFCLSVKDQRGVDLLKWSAENVLRAGAYGDLIE